mmetsp:Transcript_9981/g.16649  ORF Transcript_9981/g.16649 Transcript_9981/m.16649 type:complete len:217 (-) Transcript_9981:213-863(-)
MSLEQLILEHFSDERQVGCVGLGERRHYLTRIRFDKARKRRHGTWHLSLRHKSHDAEHGETAVVDLSNETCSLLLWAHVLLQAKRVNKVKRHRVRHPWLERGKESGLSATHIVLLARKFEDVCVLAHELEESNEPNDLQLGRSWKCIPLVRWATGSRNFTERDLAGNAPREVDAIGLNAVTDESCHRNSSVFNFRMPQETNGGLLALAELIILDEI